MLLAKPHEEAVFKSLQHDIFVYFRKEICSRKENTIVGFGRSEYTACQLSHWGEGGDTSPNCRC